MRVDRFLAILGNYFAVFVDIMNKWGWIAVGLNAALFPILVLTGMHNSKHVEALEEAIKDGVDVMGSVLDPIALSTGSIEKDMVLSM